MESLQCVKALARRRIGALGLAFVWGAVWLVALAGALSAQPAGPIAVLPFADEVGMRADLARFAALRLAQRLAQQGYPVVPLGDVERVVREAGLSPADLKTIAGASEAARRAGARLFITGSLIRADLDPARVPLMPDDIPEGPPAATVVLVVHLGSAVTRGLPVRTEVHGYTQGVLPLRGAAELAIADYVRRFPALLRRLPGPSAGAAG